MEDRITPRRGKRPLRHTDLVTPDHFDVTSVIGRVVFDGTGDDTPHEAAFRIIARHDTPGEYTFPLPDGGTCRVAVTYEGGISTGNGDTVA
jgi:hypothetical protein